MKNENITLNTSVSSKVLTHRDKPRAPYETSLDLTTEIRPKKIKNGIKPIIGKSHERSKSNIKSFGDAVIQTSASFQLALSNFRSELLGLKHNERYSAETESLAKLIHKYSDRFWKVEQKYKLRKCLEKPDPSRPNTRHYAQKATQPGIDIDGCNTGKFNGLISAELAFGKELNII